MFIAWSGRGPIVAAVSFGSLLAFDFLTGRYFGDRSYYAHHGWPKLAAFWLAAAIVWQLNPRTTVDEYRYLGTEASHRSVLRPGDSFFFVPVRYWPSILCLLGVGAYFL